MTDVHMSEKIIAYLKSKDRYHTTCNDCGNYTEGTRSAQGEYICDTCAMKRLLAQHEHMAKRDQAEAFLRQRERDNCPPGDSPRANHEGRRYA